MPRKVPCRHAPGHGSLTELTDRLRRGSRKITGQREAVLDLLSQSENPLTTKEIFGRLPAGDCDLATVYRSLHLLEQLGMVARYDFGDGVARFELVREGHPDHHHHLICRRCTRVVELDGCLLSEIEGDLARRHGFKSVNHKLEFFGICPACQ
ncbi:MAG: Fur family transcriptional regulator [Limisphaerales bacterium]